MTVSAQVIANKPNCASFLVSFDGGAGTTLDITNAQLAAAVPAGQFREFMQKAVADQAEARLRLLGQGAPAVLGGLGPNLTDLRHCRTFVRRRTLASTNPLLVDANTAVVAGITTMILHLATAGIAAASWQVDVEYQYTAIR